MSVSPYCQQSNPYSPFDYDCYNALNQIKTKFPTTVTATGPQYAACNVVASSGQCALSLCLSPGETIPTNKYFNAVNDTLSICQSQVEGSKARAIKTAGFANVPGFNSTFQIFGTSTPKPVFCSTNPYISANATDCNKAFLDMDRSSNLFVDGCVTWKQNGTCSASICAPTTANVHASEIVDAFKWIQDSCSSSGYLGGVASLDNNYNVSFWPTPQLVHKLPTPTPAPLSCFFGDQSPLRTDCDKVAQEIQTRYPTNITQTKDIDDCYAVHQVGTCKAEFCAKKGTVIKTPAFLSAFANVTSGCKGGGNLGQEPPYTGGTFRLGGSTVGATKADINRNIFCSSDKRAPLSNDCNEIMMMINPTYTFRHTTVPCQQVGAYGTCKLNYCAPAYTTFTGQQLIDSAMSVYQACITTANQFQPYSTTSGTMLMNPNWNISFYGSNEGRPFGKM